MKTFLPLVTGTLAVSSLEVINSVELPTTTDTSDVIKIILQVVISLATLFGLFKKNRDKTN